MNSIKYSSSPNLIDGPILELWDKTQDRNVVAESSLAWRILEKFPDLVVMLSGQMLSEDQLHRVNSNEYC